MTGKRSKTPQHFRTEEDTQKAADTPSALDEAPALTDEGTPKRKPRRWIVALVTVLVLAAGGFAGWMWWKENMAQITIDGREQIVRTGTTVAELIDRDHIETKPGNRLSITGAVLEEGGGDPYSVTVDGRDLGYKKGSAYAVKNGDTIVVDPGADTTEESTTEEVTTAPKLRFEGTPGAITYVAQWGIPTKEKVVTGKESGEQQTTTVQEGADCIVRTQNITPADGQKLVALTFDDGPSSYTQRYLDILSSHNATATFFCLGKEVDAQPELAKAIVDSGCEIASHTYSHDNLTKDTTDTMRKEISSAFEAIHKATGVSTTMFRPPYGAYDQACWKCSDGIASISVIWNMDSQDWRRPGVDKIVHNATDGIQPGYIILMHDGGGNRDQDLEALPRIIDTLHGQGYTFVTLSDLMKSDSSIPAKIASADATMPEGAVWPTDIA